MKLFKRIAITVCAAVFVFALVPASSFAVDPVSASTMANAFAQAITAYGASQGVSMTFDVTNTDGIGEGVHDLWDQYAADMAQSNVTVSDYSNLAASVFPTLWKKTFDYVTVSLDAAAVGEIDGFWNWLLSGPAEMIKVDNEYYEWTLNQNNLVDPIQVYYHGLFPSVPVISESVNSVKNNGLVFLTKTDTSTSYYIGTVSSDVYMYYLDYQNDLMRLYVITENTSGNCFYSYDGRTTLAYIYINWLTNTPSPLYGGYYGNFQVDSNTLTNSSIPVFTSNSDAYNAFVGRASSDQSISVQPYVGDAVPQDVYIPDNTDVNYTPVAVEIPLDILWDDTLFGDGTSTLTDAQSEAVTQAADDAITDNPAKTLELADTDTPPGPSPGTEVYIPLLPVTLPSFNFSFSGIWHYVVTWVGTLGSWLTLMFNVWNSLPYAIVVPVYASAVVVIILGTLKRFL